MEMLNDSLMSYFTRSVSGLVITAERFIEIIW